MNKWYPNCEIEMDVVSTYAIVVDFVIDNDIADILLTYMDFLWRYWSLLRMSNGRVRLRIKILNRLN